MLKEITINGPIGKIEDISMILRIIFENQVIAMENLNTLVRSSMSRDSDLENVITLLVELEIINKKKDLIQSLIVSDMSIGDKKTSLLINKRLINKLFEANEFSVFFNDSIIYDVDSNNYYVPNYAIDFNYSPVRNLLVETDFFIQQGSRLIIGEKSLILIKKKKQKKVSLDELLLIKEKQMEMGMLSEQYVLEYEKRRLDNHKSKSEISIISNMDVAAGFDIVSFDDESSTRLDRFIEVKSFYGKVKFYWSHNEVVKAKKFGNKYKLYLVDLNKYEEMSYKPEIISNPYQYFFIEEKDNWMIQNELQSFLRI